MGVRLEVDNRSFAAPRLGALYTEYPDADPAGLAIDPELAYDERQAVEVEAECYLVRSPWAKRKFCYAPRSLEDMDPERIRALRRRIEQLKPDWVEQIRLALQIEENDTYKIIAYSGVPPYPAVAILQNMKARGELAGG